MSFDLASRLAARRAEHLYRQRPLLQSPQMPEVVVDGEPLLAFCSNDYLGLANHPEVIAAMRQGAERWGVGGGASHLVIGHSTPHHELEEALAEFTGRPRALLFSTGYMANLAAVTALVGQGDTVLEDRINHASLLDAGLLSGARFSRYLHNDATSLARRLEKACGNTLVVTDGVFSMDGDLADLPAICAEAKPRNAWVMVDDAHGFGPLGATGGGIVEHFGLGIDEVPVLVGTPVLRGVEEGVVLRPRDAVALETSADDEQVLAALARNPGRVFSRTMLLERVWGDSSYRDPRTIDVHIRHLREKLEAEPKHPELILTVRGVGYVFAKQQD